MQVILTKEEYDELEAKAHPSEYELVKGLVEIASKHIKNANEKNKLLHLTDEEQRGIRYTQYLDELSDKPWLPPIKVKYIVTVERVEEDE